MNSLCQSVYFVIAVSIAVLILMPWINIRYLNGKLSILSIVIAWIAINFVLYIAFYNWCYHRPL